MMPAVIAPLRREKDSVLEFQLVCNSRQQTAIAKCYQTHPLSISRPFRLDAEAISPHKRAYIYLRNNSPGLLAGDRLGLKFFLQDRTQLYLTEQSATKVHPMPENEIALVDYRWTIGRNAIVEFVPEPIILYRNSRLEQKTRIEIDPTASLFWCDLVVPGRLARGECYEFGIYSHDLEIVSVTGELWLRDKMLLQGKDNPFRGNNLWAKFPIWGSAIAIMPQIELSLLHKNLDDLAFDLEHLQAGISILPHNRGVIIKAFAAKTQTLKSYFHSAIAILRHLNRQPALPFIPK